MATTSADVPGLYDLVIAVSGGNTTGFLLDDALEPSVPFRTHRAIYSYTPTFIERQNVSGDFGDNQQDFFLTATQRDWGLGNGQRYLHQSDADSSRRYWSGDGVEVSDAGQVTLLPSITTLAPSAQPLCVAADPIGISAAGAQVAFASSTKLFTVKSDGTITDRSTHGLGASPARWGLCSDGTKAYLSSNPTDNAGSLGVRTWDTAVYATFSATGADSLAFLNNTLYGLNYANGTLYRYDSAGTATALFAWKDARGVAQRMGLASSSAFSKIFPFGGKLGILLIPASQGTGTQASLWIYDGTAPSLVAEFPQGFQPYDACVAAGQIFVSGVTQVQLGLRATIRYWASGSEGILWQAAPPAKNWQAANYSPAMLPWGGGLFFTERPNTWTIYHYYDPATGGIAKSRLISNSNAHGFGGAPSHAVAVDAISNVAYLINDNANALLTTGSVSTSLFDFDSSLAKFFRGITVEFDHDTQGTGDTVDVAYQVDSVDGNYTSLATGITSGAETTLSGVSGKRISVKVTLNKGSTNYGPTIKRISVRAAPLLTRYRQQEYILNCAGDPSTEDAMALRDDGNSTHPLSGRQQVNELRLAAASQTPLTLIDRFGSYLGVIEVLEAYEQHPSNADPSRSGSFLVKLGTREV